MLVCKWFLREDDEHYYFIFINKFNEYLQLTIDNVTGEFIDSYYYKRVKILNEHTNSNIQKIDFMLNSFDEKVTTEKLIEYVEIASKTNDYYIDKFCFDITNYLKEMMK